MEIRIPISPAGPVRLCSSLDAIMAACSPGSDEENLNSSEEEKGEEARLDEQTE